MSPNVRLWLRGHAQDPLYRHSYLLLGSAGISAASGFLFWIIAARLSNLAAVGRGGALVSAVALLSYLTSLGLPYGILRFGAVDSDLSSNVNVAVLLTVVTSVLASLVFSAGATVWTPAIASLVQPPARLALFVAVNVGGALIVLFDNLFAARRAAQFALGRSALTAAAKLGALPVVVGLGAIGIYGAAMVPVVTFALVVMVALPRLLPGYRFRELHKRGRTGEFLRYSLHTYPSTLLGGAPPFFLPLIALVVVGVRETAYFYVAWNLLAVILIVPSIISNMSLSEGSRQLPWEMADRARRFAISIILPLTAILVLLAGPILRIFGQAYAAGAAVPLRIFAISLIPWAFMSVNQAALRVDSRHRELAAISLIFAVLTLVAPIAFGLVWGLKGLATGWTFGVFLTSATLGLLAGRHRQEERGHRGTRKASRQSKHLGELPELPSAIAIASEAPAAATSVAGGERDAAGRVRAQKPDGVHQ